MTASAGPALKRLHEEYRDRVAFVTLYVREAHPGERYPQPASIEQKREHAHRYRQRDGLSWPVAVDDVDGSLHRALDPKPSAVYIMDTGGRVAFRALWSNDERVVRQGLEAVAAGTSPSRPDRKNRLLPMLSGSGMQYEILDQAGRVAKRDLLKQAPPMYAMARLASLFRPLSPLGRGLAATALSIGVATLVARQVRARASSPMRPTDLS